MRRNNRNKVVECLMNHVSIRRFKNESVSEEDIETIIKAAVRAPSAGNMQNYSLVLVDDLDKRKAMGLSHAPLVVVALADQNRNKKRFELSDAPFYFDKGINLFVSYWDAVIALHNLVIAAESIGLGAYYMGRVLKMDISTILGIPEHVFPAGLVCLGYPDEKPDLMTRLPLEAVVHRNNYKNPTKTDIAKFYSKADKTWDSMPPKRLERLAKRGINNHAQMITLGRYTENTLQLDEVGLAANLQKSGFKVSICD
ncbi:MAG TPA: nitroreductase family protein [Caldisericia bacterium]|nr:nitroreductase family protein [Caldisericia bacterium]HPF48434.1 nitroreductase family protein [Caldisericia bacterium]HPI83386.1 nitroreductase family protein [Caldisericia bacterium]HPQ92888.1 nitroreductase family protein [Caldisericia bacterium]HRV74014.1 nitroreductase family protein [Caldisericia bacterium]